MVSLQSIHNYAVLTDYYAAMEVYKGDTLTWIYGRMENPCSVSETVLC